MNTPQEIAKIKALQGARDNYIKSARLYRDRFTDLKPAGIWKISLLGKRFQQWPSLIVKSVEEL